MGIIQFTSVIFGELVVSLVTVYTNMIYSFVAIVCCLNLLVFAALLSILLSTPITIIRIIVPMMMTSNKVYLHLNSELEVFNYWFD